EGLVKLDQLGRDDQYEFGARLHLPYPLLSDVDCLLERELGIPAVDVTDELRVYRRVTVITRDGVIEKVFYPVFPPDEAPEQVMTYLRDTLVS
ncbi:MAG: redoxin family protein, partial [Actinomycetota bacterium]